MRFFLVILALLCSLTSFTQNLEAYFNLSRFNVPDVRPYIDVFISFNGRTVKYIDGKSIIESTILIKNGEHIVDFRKTKVESPIAANDSIPTDFVDVQRFSLKNGKYSIAIFLRDMNVEGADTLKISYPFELFFSGNQVDISDIELVDRIEKTSETNLFTRSGYQVIPFVSDYYTKNRNEIMFYAEVYNTNNKFGSEGKFLLVSQITDTGGEVVGNFRKMTRMDAADVSVVLNKFNIEELYSGTYQLQLEVRDSENKLIERNAFQFFRNNPIPIDSVILTDDLLGGEVLFTEMITDREVLIDNIKSMWPRAEQLERSIIDKQTKTATTEQLQQFMYTFWFKRDPNNPQEAWDKYNDLVNTADDLYGTQIRKGYETDRGRVFLQYGKPNKLVDVPSEPSSYPYQIWQYYHVEYDGLATSNVRFVFYNKSLATNDYVLLHSDMRGEVYYRRWEAELHSRTTPMNLIDDNNAENHTGGRALDYYDNPR